MIAAIRGYIDKMIRPREKEQEVTGMKVLIVDKETKGIISMVYGMSDVLAKDVFHVMTLDQERTGVKHMKAIVFIRANADNLRFLQEELAAPKCMEYHLFFSNILPAGYLTKLAEFDVAGTVMQVQEFYADFYAVNRDLVSLNLGGSLTLQRPTGPPLGHLKPEEATFLRAVDGCAGVLLSLKLRPYVRFQEASPIAANFARAMDALFVQQRDLFHFAAPPAPGLLLVLDRALDPVTPLLTQWTYQAMVHELLGLWNNRVDLSSTVSAKAAAEEREVILSAAYDEFFASHMYDNFGEFAEAVQSILSEYQSKRSVRGKINSIEDMQRFMDTFSDLQRQGSTVGKHVRLMSEINRLVDARRLLDISELEQNLVVTTSQSAHFMAVRDMITSRPPIEDFDALRLVLIYALRYQSDTESIHVLKDMLVTRGIGRSDVALVDAFMAYGAAAFRSTGLFGTESVFKQLSKSMSRSIRGVQNVFAQHEPLVHEIMTDLTKGRLAKPQYPFVGTELPPGELGVVVIFVLGGVTYEESVFVARANTAAADAGLATRFILAGTAIHNSRSFLADLRRRAGAPEDAAAGGAAGAAGGGGAGGAVVATAGGARARGGSSDASSSSSVSVRIGRP